MDLTASILNCLMHTNRNIPSAATVNQAFVPPPGSIRIGPFMGIPRVLQQLGHDPKPVLRRFGLTLKSMSNPDMIVTFAKVGRLLCASAEVSGCPHFGLLVGQQVTLRALGVLGFTIQNAADVDTALADHIR
jgi:hypothetical protein